MSAPPPAAPLAEVARQYRSEALNCKYWSPDYHIANAMAAWCEEAVANRTPDDHHASLLTSPYRTISWANRHGYQAAITGAGLGAGCVSLIMQRGDETVIASIPARLHWDGKRITVVPPESRA
ncbi:hypothetical protein AB0M57_04630 [Streptomyces sp. NPDC051597]|uniref:hypothetical protein n=1 Tax=Streptomyces sp. NPDC051597 TaxID=3155049 RepID=UPI00341B00B1